jgi:hypothetical protein
MGEIARIAPKKNRQIVRLGVIDGENEAELLYEPLNGKLALRYKNERKGTEVVIGKSFKVLSAPGISKIIKNLDGLAEKGMDGELIGLLKDMVSKMGGLLPPPKSEGKG